MTAVTRCRPEEAEAIRLEAQRTHCSLSSYSEKRLARVLLMLTHFGKEGEPETVVPKIRHRTSN